MTLTIRPSQLDALQRSALLANLADFSAHAQQFHGQVSDAIVRQAVEQAWQFGLRAHRDLLAFLDLAIIFGADWSTPETQWLRDGVTNPKLEFRIYSDGEIAPSKRTGVSSTLTGLLHNNKEADWLFTWLRDKLVQLAKALKAACGADKAVFFLKGGRAAKYLLGLERKGENDAFATSSGTSKDSPATRKKTSPTAA